MNDNLKDGVIKYLTLGIILVILVGGGVLMYPNYQRGEKLKRDNAELREKIAAKQREIAELANNQRRFQSDADFVETIARQNHRVLPGELVFVFEKD